MHNKISNIFFWGIISAAFIGPGTITTAASAGAGYGYKLLWALVFSIIACIVLQEAGARLRLTSGKNLSEILNDYFKQKKSGTTIVFLMLGSVIFGCAAYETGNILGAIAGAGLVLKVPSVIYTLVTGVITAGLLWFGSSGLISKLMGVVVAFMGICFIYTAFVLQPNIAEVFKGSFIPSFPSGSGLFVLGLIGTTVVPYNLFLGSALAHNQSLREMRFSLTSAIILGGIISAAVLIVGASLPGLFSFQLLADTLQQQLGTWANYLLGFGLFAAGLSSALTAPLAAALIARSLWADEESGNDAGRKDHRYRLTWGVVLSTGILFGLLNIKPVPAIVLAQALNGIILPLVAIFLLLMVNNTALLTRTHINSGSYNLLMSAVVFFTILLGVRNVLAALARVFHANLVDQSWLIGVSLAVSLGCIWPLYRTILRLRNPEMK